MCHQCTQSEYHLPSSYNETKINLLPRDPYCLFAYWEIPPSTFDSFHHQFGHELWEKSVPILRVSNVSLNTNFYVRINDQATNWYINVDHPDSLYSVDIGRLITDNFFINFACSNYTSTPRNTLSPNTQAYFANYQDLKNGYYANESNYIYETYGFNPSHHSSAGLSSPELVSINISEHFGISSEFFIR